MKTSPPDFQSEPALAFPVALAAADLALVAQAEQVYRERFGVDLTTADFMRLGVRRFAQMVTGSPVTVPAL